MYPYGLNESASDKETNSSVLQYAVGRLFPPLPRKGSRSARPRENRNDRSSNLSCREFFDQLDDLLHHNIRSSFNEIRKLLNLTKKKVLKEIAFHILERDTFPFYDHRFQVYHYILDIIDTKLYKPSKVETKKIPKNVITINFVNKGIDDIHISRILRSSEVTSLLPEALQVDDEMPTCTMKLDAPIRSKILNYQDTVSSLKIAVDEDVSFVENLPSCDCSDSEFCDPHHKHVVTGDLRFITNPKLRKLLSKGPNYREPKMLNYRKCRQSIESSISSAIEKLIPKYNLLADSLSAWKSKILELVDSRIRALKLRKKPSITKPLLENEEVKTSLSELHSKFVVVPIDKASNNVAIICKRFYIQKLLDKVGVPGDNSPTYKLSDKDPSVVIENNVLLCEKLDLSVEDRL